MIIDFHVHAYPDWLGDTVLPFLRETPPGVLGAALSDDRVDFVKRQARLLLKPYSSSAHKLQTLLRHVPEGVRQKVEIASGLAPLPGLLVESTSRDLLNAMRDSGVDRAVLIAHPPRISNEWVLEQVEENPELIAAVNIPPGTDKPETLLKEMTERGAKILKLHPAADGEGPDSPRYRALLKAACELALPVIIHTGKMGSKLLFKDPEMGEPGQFANWFKAYPDTPFILAHMNYHDPLSAFDLCEQYANLFVDTSWQPAEIIGEAVRRLGPERILFASDWPLLGNNIAVSMDRIHDCIQAGMITQGEADLILGGNAVRILKLEQDSDAS